MLQTATFLLSGESALIFPVIGILAGSYLFYGGFRRLQRRRLIRKTPSSEIHQASMGLVEISGYATGPYVIFSPLERRECYYFRTIACERRQHGNRTHWAKVAEETLHVPFYIDDGTEKLLLDPRAAELDLERSFREEYSSPGEQPMPEAVREFLLHHGVNPNQQIKVEEYSIKPQQLLFALGTLSQNPGLDASIMPSWAGRLTRPSGEREPTAGPEIIRLSSDAPELQVSEMSQQQRIAAALMKAGISSPSGWETEDPGKSASEGLPQSVSRSPVCLESPREEPGPAESGCFDLHPPVVLMKGSRDREFLISSRSPRQALASFDCKHTLMVAGGAGVIVGSIYWLVSRLGGL